MQPYIKMAFISRGYSWKGDYIPLCEYCEERGAVDVDHIFWRREWKLLEPENLMFVCRQCHLAKGDYDDKQRRKEIVFSKLLPQYRWNI